MMFDKMLERPNFLYSCFTQIRLLKAQEVLHFVHLSSVFSRFCSNAIWNCPIMVWLNSSLQSAFFLSNLSNLSSKINMGAGSSTSVTSLKKKAPHWYFPFFFFFYLVLCNFPLFYGSRIKFSFLMFIGYSNLPYIATWCKANF